MVTKTITTQEAGLPITQEQVSKIKLLVGLMFTDLPSANEWLLENFSIYMQGQDIIVRTIDYPADRWLAWQTFCERFAFYDMIAIPEYQYVQKLLRRIPHLCQDPKKLLNPERYDGKTWEETRWQFEQRLALFDCGKGIHLILGEAGAGKSCWGAVHSHHLRDWFGQGVISYKHKLPEKFGDSEFIDDNDFIDELVKVTEIVNTRKGDQALKWVGDKDKVVSRLHGKTIIIEEAHKVIGAEDRTLLSLYWKDVIGEWRHYDCCIFLLTHAKRLIDPYRVHPYFTHEINISLNLQTDDVSDVRIYNMESMTHKPIISLNRRTYGDTGLGWWKHNSPISMRSNITSKQVREKQELSAARNYKPEEDEGLKEEELIKEKGE